MKDIAEITIVLENCESYTFASGDVVVYLHGINKHVWEGVEFNTVEHTLIAINKDAEPVEKSDITESDWQVRIHKDITQVWFIYDDDTEVGYHLDWNIKKSEFENAYERDIEDKGRKVYIISRKKRSINDF